MKRHFKPVAILITVLVAFSLSSCFSLPGVGGFNPLADLQAQVSARASAEISSAAGITGMQRSMMFSVLYSQIFFIGGFGADYYDLAETQGTVWRMETRDEDGTVSVVEAERAFLKALPSGQRWWYLAWRADGESWEFEALMDSELNARKIRYFNADVKRVEETVFDDPQTTKGAEESETTAPEASPVTGLNPEDLPEYSKGKEKIKVGAGAFVADRLEWSFLDEEENVTYRYTWWVDPKAPGGIVKFEWTRSDSKEFVKGELVSMRMGYKTKFSSY